MPTAYLYTPRAPVSVVSLPPYLRNEVVVTGCRPHQSDTFHWHKKNWCVDDSGISWWANEVVQLAPGTYAVKVMNPWNSGLVTPFDFQVVQ